MADNLYMDQGGGIGRAVGEIGLFAGAQYGQSWARKALLTRGELAEARRLSRGFGIFRNPGKAYMNKLAYQRSRDVWSAFTGSGSARGGWSAAWRGQTAEALKARKPGSPLRYKHGTVTSIGKAGDITVGHSGEAFSKSKRTFTRGMRALGKKRAIAGLAYPVASFASAYLMWGQLLPIAAEMTVGGFNELARFGQFLERGTPETSVGHRDMATRERAFTMRQASLMAMHQSQTGVRAALGNEASFLHT